MERLAGQDPWRGLMDPVDGGVFRYATMSGWYHPHFERSARDNFSWVELLRARGDDERAARIARYARTTFVSARGVAASQASDPFYYRLRAAERRGVPPPAVDPLYALPAAAAAARTSARLCAPLLTVDPGAWPALELAPDDVVRGGRGICDASPARCAHALAAVRGLPIDPAYVPPLVHLNRSARR